MSAKWWAVKAERWNTEATADREVPRTVVVLLIFQASFCYRDIHKIYQEMEAGAACSEIQRT